MSNITSLTSRPISSQQGSELDSFSVNDPLSRLADRVHATLNQTSAMGDGGNQPGQEISPSQIRDLIAGISPGPLPGTSCSSLV